MALILRKEETERVKNRPDPFAAAGSAARGNDRQPSQDASFLGTMIAVLAFANRGAPNKEVGLFATVWTIHRYLVAAALLLLFNSYLGMKKTVAYVGLVIVTSTVTGIVFGAFAS